MQNKAKNKAVGVGSPTKGKVEKEYTFPTHNIVIKASSPEEAREILAKKLQGGEDNK